MITNPDGSVTLTKEELEELHKAYQSVVNVCDNMPITLSDFFYDEEDYVNVRKWKDTLNGEEFVRSNWVDEEDEEEDDEESKR